MSDTDDPTDDAPTTVMERPEAESQETASDGAGTPGRPEWWLWVAVCAVALAIGGGAGWALGSGAADPEMTELKADLEEAEEEIDELEDEVDEESERADAAEAEAEAAASAATAAKERVSELEAAARARDKATTPKRTEPASAPQESDSDGIGAAKSIAGYSITLTKMDTSDNPIATFEVSNGGDEPGAPLCDGTVAMIASNGTSYPVAGNFDGGACSSVLPGTSRSATVGFNAPAGVTPVRVSILYGGGEAVWWL